MKNILDCLYYLISDKANGINNLVSEITSIYFITRRFARIHISYNDCDWLVYLERSVLTGKMKYFCYVLTARPENYEKYRDLDALQVYNEEFPIRVKSDLEMNMHQFFVQHVHI